MPAPYRLDLRQKAVSAVDRGERKSHICKTLNISRNTLDLWLKRRDETGSVAPNRKYRHEPTPTIDDLSAFETFANEHGNLTQQEMAEQWPTSVSRVTIAHALRKIEFTRKKTDRYRERDKSQRSTFVLLIGDYARERFVYVDEASIDNTLDYPDGYCHRSQRFPGEKRGHRPERVSLICGWNDGQAIAPMSFEGYCNSLVVCQWVEDCLLPELGPGKFVIMDNASFHPKEKIRTLVEQAHCEVIFLPPYSPELNKIEKSWARLKHYVRKQMRIDTTLSEAIDNAFRCIKLMS